MLVFCPLKCWLLFLGWRLIVISGVLGISIDLNLYLDQHLDDANEEHVNYQGKASFDLRTKLFQSKIFQGSLSGESYGFMVAIIPENSSEIFCGASLIDESHLLTAGHCAAGINDALENGEKISAWIAPRDLNNFSGQKLPIKSVKRHERFEPRPVLQNDIAVITLESSVYFNPKENSMRQLSGEPSLICLGTEDYQGTNVTLIGFGDYDCFSSSAQLRAASGRALNSTSCTRAGHKKKHLLDSQICAQLFNHNHERADQLIIILCIALLDNKSPGDSGGPLFFEDEAGNFVQVGLVSYNYIRDGRKDPDGNPRDPCPDTQIPGTYTRVGSYRDFIQELAPNARFC